MTASFAAAGVRIRARAWVLDAVLDVHSHPLLVNPSSDEREISHEYVKKMFESCDSYRANKLNTMRGLDLISFSMPKHSSSLLNKSAVPVTVILHGTHEIGLHTVQAMFGRIEGFRSVWTPIDYGPGTMYRAFEDHPMYKTFLETSSTLQADPITHIRVDYIGNSGTRQATIAKLRERSRIWKFDRVINFLLHPGLINEHKMFHNYLRHHILSGNSVWEQSADAWELVSYAMQKDCSSVLNGCPVPVHGIFVHRKGDVRQQSFQGILDCIPGLDVTWTPVYVGQGGGNFASTGVYKDFLDTSTTDLADPNPDLMIRVDVRGNSYNAQAQKRGPAKGFKRKSDNAPPKTPASAAPMLASEPSVIPAARPLPPHTPAVRRRTAAQRCRRVPRPD